jgi:DNA-binding response OmpR family regulator
MSSDHAAPGFWKSFAKSVIFLMDFSTAVAMAYESRDEYGPFKLDAVSSFLFCGERHLALRPKLVKILTVLVEARDSTVGKDELLNRVWAGTA